MTDAEGWYPVATFDGIVESDEAASVNLGVFADAVGGDD